MLAEIKQAHKALDAAGVARRGADGRVLILPDRIMVGIQEARDETRAVLSETTEARAERLEAAGQEMYHAIDGVKPFLSGGQTHEVVEAQMRWRDTKGGP